MYSKNDRISHSRSYEYTNTYSPVLQFEKLLRFELSSGKQLFILYME